MATLTWQDVAGRVAAPDFSDASALITQGIGQVSAAAKAPERLRQEQLDREMKGLLVQSEMNDRTSNMIDKIDTKQKNEVKERDLREFSKNQSYLESASRKAAMDGISLPDFLATDKVYQSMGDGAKAYSAANLSDAHMRGDETRSQREEQAADNARQERHFQQQFAAQQQQFRASESRANREFSLRERELGKREQEAREAAGLISRDAQTNIAWRDRAMQLSNQLAPIQRGMELYGKISPNEAAEKGGIMNKNWFANGGREAQKIQTDIEKKTGKKIDTWMINQLLVEGGGADNTRMWPGGNIDNNAAEDYLLNLVQLREAAEYNQRFFDQMTQEIRNGKTYSADNLNKNYPIRTGVSAPLAAPKKRNTNFNVPRAGRE